jgi:hypothetical protein
MVGGGYNSPKLTSQSIYPGNSLNVLLQANSIVLRVNLIAGTAGSYPPWVVAQALGDRTGSVGASLAGEKISNKAPIIFLQYVL